jgi:hypothetical protein
MKYISRLCSNSHPKNTAVHCFSSWPRKWYVGLRSAVKKEGTPLCSQSDQLSVVREWIDLVLRTCRPSDWWLCDCTAQQCNAWFSRMCPRNITRTGRVKACSCMVFLLDLCFADAANSHSYLYNTYNTFLSGPPVCIYTYDPLVMV